LLRQNGCGSRRGLPSARRHVTRNAETAMTTFPSKFGQPLGDVLVTGGAGAIGSRRVVRLLPGGAERVVVADVLSSGYEWLLPTDSRVELVRQDVCRLSELNLDLREPVIFHLAAFFANQNSVDHPRDDLHTNGLGTLTALVWSREKR